MAKYLRPQSCHFLVRENVHFYYFEGKNVQINPNAKLFLFSQNPLIYHTAILKAHFPHEQFSIKIVVVAQ